MEILAALLTAATYWLLVFYDLKGRQERQRERAGAMIFERLWCHRRWYWALAQGVLLFSIVFSRVLMFIFIAWRWTDSPIRRLFLSWESPFGVTALLTTIIKSPLLILVLPRSFEFRERAFVISQGPMSYLVPWSRVQYAAPSPISGKLEIRTRLGKHVIGISSVDANRLLAALASVVETKDRNGSLFHPEIQAYRQEQASNRQLPPWRFQVDLQTMLVFVLFASAAMSWYAVRYHRDEAERAALARLEPFKPSVMGSPYFLWIDFSSSPVKPGDDDLALLSDLARLDDLNLTGAPITDAGLVHLERFAVLNDLNLSHTSISDEGLKHLERLSNLRQLYLRRTRVTREGVERLKRANPNLDVKM